jgi:hypothetical protein
VVTAARAGGGEDLVGGAHGAFFRGKFEDGDGVVVPLVGFVIIDAATGDTHGGIAAE